MKLLKSSKNLNTYNFDTYPMNKRGIIEIGVGIVILLIVISVGSISTYKAFNKNRYIVDNSTNTIYDLLVCSTSHLDQSNLVYLSDLDANNNQTYTEAQC